jgi:hypothetical protein
MSKVLRGGIGVGKVDGSLRAMRCGVAGVGPIARHFELERVSPMLTHALLRHQCQRCGGRVVALVRIVTLAGIDTGEIGALESLPGVGAGPASEQPCGDDDRAEWVWAHG